MKRLYYHLPEEVAQDEREEFITQLLAGNAGERAPLIRLRNVKDENGDVVYRSLTMSALSLPEAIGVTPEGQEEYFTSWGFSLIFL